MGRKFWRKMQGMREDLGGPIGSQLRPDHSFGKTKRKTQGEEGRRGKGGSPPCLVILIGLLVSLTLRVNPRPDLPGGSQAVQSGALGGLVSQCYV